MEEPNARYWNIYFLQRFVATVIASSEAQCREIMLARGYCAQDVAEMTCVDTSACGKAQYEARKGYVMPDRRYTNARFWITYRGGSLVKLTMRPGDTIELAEGGATEEGYHQYSKYEYPKDEAVIYAEFEESARDCDGRLDSHNESCCPVADLKNGYANESDWPGPGIAFPDWRSVRAFQRDYEAEKAGY